ncbi:MAG: DNA-cytosine methyltransferase [Syntrophus sp. PtaU1.Bin208]|nr:MAG: DNA-cytosine methyltransferase [Syntrophus sp. PtaU1.Bin208]
MTDILVRNVPEHIVKWIGDGVRKSGVSKNRFINEALKIVYNQKQNPSLFAGGQPSVLMQPDSLPFKFIDLFAGIGGFRSALSKLGGRCVFSSEYDKYSRKTYCAWYNENDEDVWGDINLLEKDDQIRNAIPDHDILAAGFPCQPFSLAGVSKKKSLGRKHGFEDEKQGNLFFKIAQIVKVKRPPVLFLENVKNLRSHDKGNTWEVIHGTLEDLGYHVFDKTIDAADWVPQHRERIIIVCFDKETFGKRVDFSYPQPPKGKRPVLGDILQKEYEQNYVLTNHLWKYLQDYAEKHRLKGNGFGFGLVGPEDQARTLSARYHKDGSEILIKAPKNGHRSVTDPARTKTNPRRLTPREAALLMGFTDEMAKLFGHEHGFPQVVSDTQAYRQFGNAVVVSVIEAVGRQIIPVMADYLKNSSGKCLLKA